MSEMIEIESSDGRRAIVPAISLTAPDGSVITKPERKARGKKPAHAQLKVFHSNVGEDGERPQNWATPLALYHEIEESFAGKRGFSIDACAEEWNAKAPFYIDESLNALDLDRPWHVTKDLRINARWFAAQLKEVIEDVAAWVTKQARELLDALRGRRDVWAWCNPPYNAIDHFLRKALRELAAGAHKGSVFLIPHRSDRTWWHELVKKHAWHIEELEGRVAFDVPPGVEITADGGFEPSAVVVFRQGMKGL